MSVLDRVGKMVRSEWNARRPRFGADEGANADRAASRPRTASPGVAPARKPAVVDTEGALRVLELPALPSLDEVRAQYLLLSRRYYPKTLSTSDEQARAARVVLDALTDALELLEEQLLPLPATPPAPGAGQS